MAPKAPVSRWSTPAAKIGTTSTMRLIWRSIGMQKTGKTRFALTAPQPVFVHSFDTGLEGVVEQFLAKGKDIRALEYPFNPDDYKTDKDVAEAANEVWKQFTVDYAAALAEISDLGRGTIVLDKETELWELLRNARLGGPTGAPKDYSVLNAEYRALIRKAYGAGANLSLIQGLKEEWISKMDPSKGKMVPHNTGKMVPQGMKEVGFLVQANFTHERVFDENMNLTYRLTVDDMRHDDAQYMVGQTLDNTDFPTIAQGIFPASTPEDWI